MTKSFSVSFTHLGLKFGSRNTVFGHEGRKVIRTTNRVGSKSVWNETWNLSCISHGLCLLCELFTMNNNNKS